jgi:hypothetical protein
MAIQQFPDFTNAVKAKKFGKAYELLFKIEDEFLFHALHSLDGPTDQRLDEFWKAWSGERYFRLEKKYADKLEKWEFAFVTVQHHTLPTTTPAYGAAMPGFGKKYLAEAEFAELHSHSTLERNLGYSMQACNYVLTNLEVVAANWDKYLQSYVKPERKTNFEYWDDEKDNALKALRNLDFTGKSPKQVDKMLRDAEARLANAEKKAGKYKNKDDQLLYDETRERIKQALAEASARQGGGDIPRLEELRIQATEAKRTRRGNCGENAALTFMFLYEMGVRPIEKVNSSEDHGFVVIGRRNADINDFETWGPDAVVADPWAQGLASGNISRGTYGGGGKNIKDILEKLLGPSVLEVYLREDLTVQQKKAPPKWWQWRKKR